MSGRTTVGAVCQQGVLVLKPNYRGSIGRGQAFADLNCEQLGIGDLWDLESAIDHLGALGWVDAARVGCMVGRRAATSQLSPGCTPRPSGRCRWGRASRMVHLPHQQRHPRLHRGLSLRLAASAIATCTSKTAPISQLARARTPMLIQHGTETAGFRCPTPWSMYRGLKEMGVPAELFVFPAWPTHHQAREKPRRDAPEPGLVQPLSAGRGAEVGMMKALVMHPLLAERT